jgi:hypothetical protein
MVSLLPTGAAEEAATRAGAGLVAFYLVDTSVAFFLFDALTCISFAELFFTGCFLY